MEANNNAMLREALECIDSIAKYLEAGTIRDVQHAYRNIQDRVRIALAAPARNCDLPLVVDGPANNNADKAWLIFKHRNPDAYFDVPGLLRCIEWLLAPATKQKGENDGNE